MVGRKTDEEDGAGDVADDGDTSRKTLSASGSREGAAEPGARRGLRTRFRPGGLKPARGARVADAPPAEGRPDDTRDEQAPTRAVRRTDRPRPEARAAAPRDGRRTPRDGQGASPQRAERRTPRPERAATPATGEAASDPRGVRLSKLMAERGLCSRREADWIIERGWVFVDGRRVSELGARISPDAEIELAPEAARRQAERVTILLHKPVGYVSGQAEDGHEPAVVLIGPDNQFDREAAQRFHRSHLRGLAPAGRLDIDSTGLLVLTQDGRIARALIGDDSRVDKEYLVRVEGRLDAEGLALLNHGLELDGRKLRPARVERVNDDQLRFVLREGRKRQIRRMCELVGLRVTGLKRVRIGKVRLGDLPLGEWRFLGADESF